VTAEGRALQVYGIRAGGRLPGGKTAVQVVGGELAIIDNETGISAKAVVDRARTPGTPLYAWDKAARYFEWDDGVAAERHREEQARLLIRTVTVDTVDGDQSLSTRGFYALKSVGQSKVYRPVGFVVANPEAHREVIDRFQNEILRIDAAYRAYLAYADFASRYAELFTAVDRVIDDLAKQGEPRAIKRQQERYRRRGGHVVLESTK